MGRMEVAVGKMGGSGGVIDPSGSLVVGWIGEIYFERHPCGGRGGAVGGVCHGATGYA